MWETIRRIEVQWGKGKKREVEIPLTHRSSDGWSRKRGGRGARQNPERIFTETLIEDERPCATLDRDARAWQSPGKNERSLVEKKVGKKVWKIKGK